MADKFISANAIKNAPVIIPASESKEETNE